MRLLAQAHALMYAESRTEGGGDGTARIGLEPHRVIRLGWRK
jgi:hypothetical protein